jgi:tetratricopeptide (TPR) repeat protein
MHIISWLIRQSLAVMLGYVCSHAVSLVVHGRIVDYTSCTSKASVLAKSGQFEQAYEHLTSNLDAIGDRRYHYNIGVAQYQAAMLAYVLGRFDEAINYANTYHSHLFGYNNPVPPSTIRVLCCIRQGRSASYSDIQNTSRRVAWMYYALHRGEILDQLKPKNMLVAYEIRVYYNFKLFSLAKQRIKSLSTNESRELFYLQLNAVAEYYHRDYDQCIKILKWIMKYSPQQILLSSNRGITHYYLGLANLKKKYHCAKMNLLLALRYGFANDEDVRLHFRFCCLQSLERTKGFGDVEFIFS